MNKIEIAKLIPHADAMCLIDSVNEWNASYIRCCSASHRNKNNPMRRNSKLLILCGIEYAAQAMAIHGGLTGAVSARPRAGYLASVRDVVCRQDFLDSNDDLSISAEKLLGDENQVMYRFSVCIGNEEILNGRATVILDANGGIK